MKQNKELLPSSVHVLRDQQGKLYLATRESFGWLSLEGQPLLYGYRDQGSIEQVFHKLAQYQHAGRILKTQVKNQFNQTLALFQSIEE